jgi:diguanylate cyclase (GGDEF)-like protein
MGGEQDAGVQALFGVLGNYLDAGVVALVPAWGETPVSIWFDRHLPGDEQEEATLAHFARAWLTQPGREECTRAVIDGWQVAMCAAGPQAVLLAARGPAHPWSESEHSVIHFAARLCANAVAGGPGVGELASRPVPETGPRMADLNSLRALGTTVQGGNSSGAPLTAYVVGIDGLSVVNDVLGYPAGNQLLEVIGARLSEWVGASGGVTALGGARFAVLRTDLPTQDAALRDASRLASRLAEPTEVAGSRVSRSASIGLAHGPAAEDTLGLIGRAIDALRHARAAGGNTVRAFDASEHARLLTRFRLELALHSAAEDGSLRLVYQPEFDLRSGALHAVEALLRWQHPERGLLGPDEFIGLAEESDAIGEIGAWVIDEAFAQLAAWQREIGDTRLLLRVNVAATQLTRHDAVGRISAALARHRLRGEQICVEITERTMPTDLNPLAAELARLRLLGASVAIDDFGTDHSTFVHLNALPVDTIKIDRSFVAGMHEDVRSAAIVAALIRLARTFGLDVVAEGVDSEEVISDLLALGCNRAQGNLLAPAQPAAQMTPILRAGRRAS